ncbi:hypothetical protein BH11PSE11_BH11PSE11_04790 [soil metagenome]
MFSTVQIRASSKRFVTTLSLIVLGVATLIASPDAAAQSSAPVLFTPFRGASNAQADAARKPDREVVRSRNVTIDAGMLNAPPSNSKSNASARDARVAATTMTLNLFDDASFVAQLDRVERTSRGQAWIGHLQGVAASQVVLFSNGAVVAGTVTMPGARFHIRFAGNGVHAIQQIDQAQYPEDEDQVPRPDRSKLKPIAQKDVLQAAAGAQGDDGSVIDVMVIYSTASRIAAGSTEAMNSLIDLAFTETNQSYLASGVAHRIRLVHAEEVAYQETGKLSEALACITDETDGCLDQIHGLRNTYRADLVSFWVENGVDACGIGWQMDQPNPAFENFAFSVVTRTCANGYYAFAHEIGHNMGANHDVMVVPPVTGDPGNHGFVNTANRWYTIMAYDRGCAAAKVYCVRIPYWSNPQANYNGDPLGDSVSDNSKVLNNSAKIVAGFRQSQASIATTTQVVEFYNLYLDRFFITANSGEAANIDKGSAGPGWARTGIVFKAGGAMPVCRFYGSQSPGPNSHFFTIDQGECERLRQLQSDTADTQKRWNFEQLDFMSTPPRNGTCPQGTVPVYRAYNNGVARGVDSNHRITSDLAAIKQVVARGWINEGVCMCAPL